MYIKYVFAGILAILLTMSVVQMFPIPPWGEDLLSIYQSEYFSELDREYSIIADSFIGIKTMARPSFAWVFLDDIEKAHGIEVRVYDGEGRLVTMPGERGDTISKKALDVLSGNPKGATRWIDGGRYHSMLVMNAGKECAFCHRKAERGRALGVLSFSKTFSARNFYTRERILIFMILSIMLGTALFFTLRWDPGRRIKELFDKKN